MIQQLNGGYRDIFLSHRSINKDFVRNLASDIESEMYKDRPLLTWMDEAEIRGGQSIVGMINEGLEKSRFIGMVLTPDYFNSATGWTDAEWHSALFSDPDNRGGKILPLLIQDCPQIPFLLRHLKVIDLRDKKYESGLRELLCILREEPLPRPVFHRGQLIENGLITRSTLISERAIPQVDPDCVTENLFCNLLPVTSLPKYVYTAPVKNSLCKKKKNGDFSMPSKAELIAAIKLIQEQEGIEKPFTPAFRCYENKIVTFHNLTSPDSIFNTLIEENEVEQIPIYDLIQNEASRLIVTSLLNMSLARHINRKGLIIDNEKHARFFFPLKDGGNNVIEWNPFKKKTKRTVAKAYIRNDAIQCWLHQGAYLKMFFLANKYYLQILPTWVVTEDGIVIKGGTNVSKIVNRWTSGERNLSLIYHVRFWTYVLNGYGQQVNIRVGDQTMELAFKPAFIQLSGGILNDRKDLLMDLDREAERISSIEDELVDIAMENEIDDEDDSMNPIEDDSTLEEYLNEEFDDEKEQ